MAGSRPGRHGPDVHLGGTAAPVDLHIVPVFGTCADGDRSAPDAAFRPVAKQRIRRIAKRAHIAVGDKRVIPIPHDGTSPGVIRKAGLIERDFLVPVNLTDQILLTLRQEEIEAEILIGKAENHILAVRRFGEVDGFAAQVCHELFQPGRRVKGPGHRLDRPIFRRADTVARPALPGDAGQGELQACTAPVCGHELRVLPKEALAHVVPGPLVKRGPDLLVRRHGFVVLPDIAHIRGVTVQIIPALGVSGKDLCAGEIGIAEQLPQGRVVYPLDGEEPACAVKLHARGHGRLYGCLFIGREKPRFRAGLRRLGDQKLIVFQRDQQLQPVIFVEAPRLAVRPEGQIVDGDRFSGGAEPHLLFRAAAAQHKNRQHDERQRKHLLLFHLECPSFSLVQAADYITEKGLRQGNLRKRKNLTAFASKQSSAAQSGESELRGAASRAFVLPAIRSC